MSLLKEKKTKSVGHKQELRVTHFFHTISLLSSSSILSYEGFPSPCDLCFLSLTFLCLCSITISSVWFNSNLKPCEDRKVPRLCTICVSVCDCADVSEINKMSVENGLRIRNKWHSVLNDWKQLMRGTSFKLLWNLRVVKQLIKILSHSPLHLHNPYTTMVKLFLSVAVLFMGCCIIMTS